MRLLIVGLFLASVPCLFGQQTGSAQRDYTIGGVGSMQISPVAHAVAIGSTVSNDYATQDPMAPIAWLMSPTSTLGWVVTPNNSVDIGPSPLLVLGNGAEPSTPFSSVFFTDAGGNFSLSVPVPASLAGTQHFAMVHLAASNPEGWWISQTHRVTFAVDPNLSVGNPNCNPLGTPLMLSDDSFSQQPLGFSFPFFGAMWTECFVGSNGFVTFMQGDADFTESVTEFIANEPRIAVWWDDLNPSSSGSVSFFTDNNGTCEACWSAVPEFSNTGANSFKVTLAAGAVTSLDYGAMSAMDGIVGLSPGGGTASGLPLNFSLAPNGIGPGDAPYEEFDSANPNDLAGLQVNFLMTPMGFPTTQL